jgi:hypothetical protein
MATARIDQLTDATTVALADELPIIQGGVTKRATVSEVKTALAIHLGTVADQAAMVALSSAVAGSQCTRTDTSTVWILSAAPYSSASNWKNTAQTGASYVQDALTPGSASLSPSVDAVVAALPNGRVQTVTINASRDIVSTDVGKVLDCVSSSATVITIRADAITGLTQATGNPVLAIRRRGSGTVTWATSGSDTGGNAVTINNPSSLALTQNGPDVLFTEVQANIWNVS